MKTTIKIFILLLAVTCAIGGVMIYAKTKVAPPKAPTQSNQYRLDVSDLILEEKSSKNATEEDEVFAKAIDRIQIFSQEGKINPSETDKCIDDITRAYSSNFLKRCFSSFKQPKWSYSTHKYIRSQSSLLEGLVHSDKTPVLRKSTIDSLNLVVSIIDDYHDARRISRVSTFTDYEDTRKKIDDAEKYANNSYLRNCVSLKEDLDSLKSRLATSCNNQVEARVEGLANYRYYKKNDYYNNLVPNVEKVLTDYKNEAAKTFDYPQETVNNNYLKWCNKAKIHTENADSHYKYF